MVTVAMIDDGIYERNNFNIIKNIEINSDLMIKDINPSQLKDSIHGTTCAEIVKRYYPNILFINIKIINNRLKQCSVEQLVEAIKWCIENKVKVINISLGTIDYRDCKKLSYIINRAYKKGIIIIAAYSNKNVFTYPASFSNVIGVKCTDKINLKEGEYIFNLYPIDGIDITACSMHTLIDSKGDIIVTRKCNSFATPMITAKVCQIVEENNEITLEEIRYKLYIYANNFNPNVLRIDNCKNTDWVDNDTIIIRNKNYKWKLNELKIKIDKKKIKNGIIFLNNNVLDKDIQFILNDKNIRIWRPSIIEHYYKKHLAKKKIDIPLIMIYDYTNTEMLNLLNQFNSRLRKEGYYSLIISTDSQGILYGFEYLEINKSIDVKNKLEILYNIYNCDIIILGINTKDTSKDVIEEIERYLTIDQKIILLHEYIDKINLKVRKNKDILIVNNLDKIKKEDFPYKIFSYKEINFIYKYTLEKMI